MPVGLFSSEQLEHRKDLCKNIWDTRVTEEIAHGIQWAPCGSHPCRVPAVGPFSGSGYSMRCQTSLSSFSIEAFPVQDQDGGIVVI